MSAPATKTIEEINAADQDDKALQAYKASLIGDSIGADGKGVAKFPDDKRKVIVDSIQIVFDDDSAPQKEMTLKSDSTLVIKEGSSFTTYVTFYVQWDIALGLKLTTATSKLGITVDSDTAMLGSFAPKLEPYRVRAVSSEAPSGFLGRSTYTFSATLHDDDKNEYYQFKSTISIKSDWA